MINTHDYTEYFSANQLNWDMRAPVHARSTAYDLAAIRAGRETLLPLEIAEIGDVDGKKLLHLMCHIGTDTVSWARRGAIVTGVDFSGESLKIAGELASDCKQQIDFIQANVCALPNQLAGQFDIVVATYGITCWLPNIALFCAQAARCLRPGGLFLLADDHPTRWIFPYIVTPGEYPAVTSYFAAETEFSEASATYTDGDNFISSPSYQWQHTLGEIITALADADLQVESLHEYPYTFWNCMKPILTQDANGWWRAPEELLPLMFSVRARAR